MPLLGAASFAWASEDKRPHPPKAPLPSQMFLLQPQAWTTILTPVSRVAGRGVEEGLIQLFAELSLDIPSLCLDIPSLYLGSGTFTPPRLPGKRSGCYFIWNYWNPTVSCQLFPLLRLSWETGTMDGLSCQGRGTAQHTHCTQAHVCMLAPLPLFPRLCCLLYFSFHLLVPICLKIFCS